MMNFNSEDLKKIRNVLNFSLEKTKSDFFSLISYIPSDEKMLTFYRDQSVKEEKAILNLIEKLEKFTFEFLSKNKDLPEFSLEENIILLKAFSREHEKFEEKLKLVKDMSLKNIAFYSVLDNINAEKESNNKSLQRFKKQAKFYELHEDVKRYY